jgi:acetyl esterase/lipase
VGALDLFVEENIEYARRLINAGVPTELHVIPGAFHGFDFAQESHIVQRFQAARIQALTRAFDTARRTR